MTTLDPEATATAKKIVAAYSVERSTIDLTAAIARAISKARRPQPVRQARGVEALVERGREFARTAIRPEVAENGTTLDYRDSIVWALADMLALVEKDRADAAAACELVARHWRGLGTTRGQAEYAVSRVRGFPNSDILDATLLFENAGTYGLAAALRIISDTLWMARRYANGRRTYAVALYNEAARSAIALGIRDVEFALDGMGPAYSGLTQAEEDATRGPPVPPPPPVEF